MNKLINLTIDCIEIVAKQNHRKEIALKQDTDILNETNLDSLDLAQVVIMLEEKTGKDPFAKGFINFRTIQDLAALYE
ncbi:MAG: acyl carrier protein [Parachlamydiaceae bacterium]|nr:acyl carrier protein [Parachlamydiaceae bacterium]